MESNATDGDRPEKSGDLPPVRLSVSRSPSRRVLVRDEVGHVGSGCVMEDWRHDWES